VEGPLQIKSVLDVGCGEGHSLRYFRELGCDVIGIDGMPQEDPDIIQYDFEGDEPLSMPALKLGSVMAWGGAKFDLVWACEFVEHVSEPYAHRLVEPFRKGKIVMMTHASPGQQGHHHVNCRDAEYWKGFMTAAGFMLSPGLTDKTRDISAKNLSAWNHYLRSGMAFRRIDK
jgi:2-polyprenyl-3-methyl-5-hydroxy-6-metoxy-1,4-benzoquinol methylase